MSGAAHHTTLQQNDIKFIIQVNNVEIPEEMRRLAGFVPVGGNTTLAILYGIILLRPLIQDVFKEVLGRKGKEDTQIGTGSLHILLHCYNAQRFVEVLDDYESGRIEERLQKEFSEIHFKVEGLKLEIENMEEVGRRKEVIERSIYAISPRIIVQGGMYRNLSPNQKEEYIRVTKESAKEGYALLVLGGTAVQAVEAAVRVLENDDHFNAGRGSLLNENSEVECDAMIMEGHTLKSGAVISGRNFLNPVTLAKEIMEESPHCAFSGDGALQFAQQRNFPTWESTELISEEAREKLKFGYANYKKRVAYFYEGKPEEETHADSVSAVAMDANGHLACALSTGGASGKLKGRVSDVAMVGCGGYANKTGAATVTGYGESIVKVTMAREVVYNMEKNQNAQKSAENGLKKMKELVNSCGGVIAIDKDGNFGKHFTTTMMAWASIKDDEIEYGIEEGKVEQDRV